MSTFSLGYMPIELLCLDGELLSTDAKLNCLDSELVYIYDAPLIKSATITPNPADINASVSLAVVVEDGKLYLKPAKIYSGEVYSGEV